MNCLRVWGGGIYERDIFYELCDRAGILVWQDFMFACAAYPIYREFLDEVEAEAVFQVQRLRNHPCLMIWCGNSENEWLHQAGNLKKGNEQRIIGETIWSHVLREVVEDNDPTRAYHQSSPFGKNRLDYNDLATGDRHSWEVWADWMPSDTWLLDTGRFISEFGIQAFPCAETVAEIAPQARELFDIDVAHHQRMPEGTERLVKYVAAHYKMPATLQGWIEISQGLQALLLGRAIEHWRRHRFHTAGCLIWQFNDAYPAISWSLLDYSRRPKVALVAAQRFFAPVLLTAELMVGEMPVGAVAPEYWHEEERLSPPQGRTVDGENAIWCTPVKHTVQCRFFVINDTHLSLTGSLNGRLLRGDEEVEALPTLQVTLEPNGSQMSLTHVLDSALLEILPQLTLTAEFVLDPDSRERFNALGAELNSIQLDLSAGGDLLLPVNLESGLKINMALVEPRYLTGPSASAS
jgi:beta-galactosidase/beta-glucuronidase